MKIHSLKFKLLGFVFLIIILLVGSIITNNMLKLDNYVNDNIVEEVSKSNEVLKDRIDELKKDSTSASIQLSANPLVINSVKTKDTQSILTTLKPIIENSGIEFITITDEKGIVLARTHDPSKSGDSVLNQLNVKTALQGKVNS